MKKLFTLIALLIVFLGARAAEVVDAFIDFSTVTEIPRFEWGGSESAFDRLSLQNGCLHFHSEEATNPAWDCQWFPIGGVAAEVGVTYTLHYKIKGDHIENISALGFGQTPYGQFPITTEWVEGSVDYECTNDNQGFFLFQAGAYVGDFDIAYLKITHKVADPIPWKELIVNGDAEKSWAELGLADVAFGDTENNYKVCCWIRENGVNNRDPHVAEIVQEAAGNHAFICRANLADSPDIDDTNSSAWDNQIWIESPRRWTTGEQFKLSFRYKASEPYTVSTHMHKQTPTEYLHWEAIGDINFTTEWQEFEQVVTVPSDGNGMWSVAFNLNSYKKTPADFYIDDISWEQVEGEEVESVSIKTATGANVSGSYITLEKGQAISLYADVNPSNATNKNVTWDVLQEDEIITFEDGVVTALKVGRAAVRVTSDENGDAQAFVYIVVTEPEPQPQPARDPMTFDIQTGETTFTVTPSSQEYQYYIEVISGKYDAETMTNYFDMILEEMGEGLEYFEGVQTQSYEDDWYIDEPGVYTIIVCDVNDDYTRNGNVVLAYFTIPEPEPQGYSAVLYNGDDTPITIENFDPTVKPAEATAANALVYVDADLSEVEGVVPNVVYKKDDHFHANEINLTDAQPFFYGHPFSCGDAIDVKKVTYTRTFTNTAWQSMVLPFKYHASDFEGKAEVAVFSGATMYDADTDGNYDMAYLLYRSETEEDNLYNTHALGHRPILIKAKEVGEITVAWNNVVLGGMVLTTAPIFTDQSGTQYKLDYTYQPKAMYQTGYYGLSNGEFKYALSENAVLPPFRAYLSITPGDGPQVPVCGLLVNDDPTAIKQINASKADNNYYDLSGRKVSNPTSGIYVKNGKKVIVK